MAASRSGVPSPSRRRQRDRTGQKGLGAGGALVWEAYASCRRLLAYQWQCLREGAAERNSHAGRGWSQGQRAKCLLLCG